MLHGLPAVANGAEVDVVLLGLPALREEAVPAPLFGSRRLGFRV